MVGGPHNDALAVLLMMLGVAGVLTARETSAGAALVAAIAIKASAAVTTPFALLGATTPRPPTGPKAAYMSAFGPVGQLLVGAGVTVVGIGLGAYLGFGWHWLDAFALAGENQGRTSHMSLPVTAARLTGLDPDATRIAALSLYAALVTYLLVWTYRGNDWVRGAAWATTGLLLATAWLLPWYLLWPLPLAALSRDRALKLLLLALTAYQLGARVPI